jgi:NitT/TauT family transport system substrate-binding protein
MEKAGWPYLREVQAGEVYDMVRGGAVVARLRLLKVDGGAGMPAAMVRGEIDVGLGGVAAIVKLADDGQPIRILAPLQTDGDMLVLKKDSPVSDWVSFVRAAKDSPKPIKIGYKAPIACAKMIFEAGAKAEGLAVGVDASDPATRIVMVNLQSEKSPLPMLANGAIDGFVMNQPAPAIAVHKGVGKVVMDLCDLPPAGHWIDHPCCCVAAMRPTIESQTEALKTLLQVLLLGTELIRSDPKLAVDCAVRWTRTEEPVEQASIPTVRYVSEPTESWLKGMTTWADMMRGIDFFRGQYASRSSAEILADACALDLCWAAASELRARGLIR